MRPDRKAYKLISMVMVIILMCMMPSGYIYAEDANSDTGYTWPIKETEPYGKAAILMEKDTGAIIYSKNIDEKLYPASITKIMTALLAIEKLNLNDEIVFTNQMLAGLPSDAAIQGVSVGERMTVRDCLYSLMLRSNNDMAVALAYAVSGSEKAFAELMTQRAKELGAENTNYVNASGLHNPNHYTTARDMALITKAATSNPTFQEIWSTAQYKLPATNMSGEMNISHRHNMLVSGRADYYQYATGGKTGYTDEAGRTLVTCAEKDGLNLICVIMYSTNDYITGDTKELFNYGFNNFKKTTIQGNEERFGQSLGAGFDIVNEVYGNDVSMFSLGEGSVVIPKNALLKEIDYELDMNIESTGKGEVALLTYKHNDDILGKTKIYLSSSYDKKADGISSLEKEEAVVEKKDITEILSINIYYILGGILAVIILAFVIRMFVKWKKRRNISKKYFIR